MKGKFYWVQSSAWHPVHQYTQQGFLAGCEKLGLDCELATTDENTLDALVALADQVVSRPDAKGVAMWFGGLPVAKPIIEKAKANGVAVALPHFPVARRLLRRQCRPDRRRHFQVSRSRRQGHVR